MASLIWRADRKRWYSYFHSGFRHTGRVLNNVPHRKKLLKRERIFAMAEAERIALDCQPVEIRDIDLETCMANWLDDVKATKSLRTWERYRTVSKQFLDLTVPGGEEIHINAVSEAHIRKYRDFRLISCTIPTVKNDIKALGAFFGWLKKLRDPATGTRLVKFNPAEDVDMPEDKAPKNRVFPKDEEIRELITLVENESEVFSGLALLGALAGMRCGEIIRLKWDQVFMTERLIHVYGKSRHPRPVPMHPSVYAFLSSLDGAESTVFPSPYAATGDIRSPYAVRLFNKFLKSHGFPFTHHGLRRWFNDSLRRSPELSASARRLVVGHEDEEVNRLYQNPQAEEARPFVERLMA